VKEELDFSAWGPEQVARAAKELGKDDKALLASWVRGL
jgi:hypothetical protein